jgi:hypothetical protein
VTRRPRLCSRRTSLANLDDSFPLFGSDGVADLARHGLELLSVVVVVVVFDS